MSSNKHFKIDNIISACAFVLMTACGAAAQNTYGGYDIMATPGAVEQDYANVKGWHVSASYLGGSLAFCSAGKHIGNTYMSIGYDGMQWQLAVPIANQPADWSGGLEVDGDLRHASGTSTSGYAIAWLGLRELDRLQRGNQAIMSVGKHDYDFSLAGITASTLKVTECVQNAGRVPTQAGANAAPAQNGGAPTVRVSCETVFGGRQGCTLTQQPQEASYLEVFTVDLDDRGSERYLVKQVDNAQVEIWLAFPEAPQSWSYKGFWQESSHDRDCIEPAPNQGLAVQDALGQDAWMLCLR